MSYFFPDRATECGHHTLFGNVAAVTLTGDTLQLSLVDIPEGGVVSLHSHVNEQVGVVLAGRALFEIGDEARELTAGDFYRMPSNVPHRVTALGGPVRALDVFHPVRDEYR